jgi:hypothetical protein
MKLCTHIRLIVFTLSTSASAPVASSAGSHASTSANRSLQPRWLALCSHEPRQQRRGADPESECRRGGVKIVLFEREGGLFHGVTGEKLNIINLEGVDWRFGFLGVVVVLLLLLLLP